ncbi:hypothetical protein [Aridibaculum aurantiacum]|uniref:hypothetical protein n=1 Tax=Aridibaculum aurantiacum TaxID=2810307 RepID=UPI001A95A86F|nr:hypothetical protein [Aridibaculum aurantiacum]
MSFFYRLAIFILTLTSCFNVAAQNEQRVKVAVFAPLYLDEAFNGNTYKLGKTNLPKHILPGLEFYNGVMMAVDSLNREGVNAEIHVFDTKQDAIALNQILHGPQFNGTGLIIASVTTPAELKLFGDVAQKRQIPFISATYPNYVGINQNPYFVLLNSSFQTHIEGLFKYMQRYHSMDKIIALKRPGNTEDYIKNTINELNKATPAFPLIIKWVEVKDDLTAATLAPHLDSTRNNVVFVASPLESFGSKAVRALGDNSNYQVTAIGMPTWDGIREFNRRDNKNVDIIYSTPFNYGNNESLNAGINRAYKAKYYSRPSDMVFRGFETTFHFTRLLNKHRGNLLNNLSDKDFTVFNNFDIQPIKRKSTNPQPDFMENKKLYFVKKREGNVVSIY